MHALHTAHLFIITVTYNNAGEVTNTISRKCFMQIVKQILTVIF